MKTIEILTENNVSLTALVVHEYCDDMLLAEDGGVIYKHATFRNRDDAFMQP